MRNAASIWNQPEMQQRLETLASAGCTAREIASALGVTRNAVLGRCHRTGIELARPAAFPRFERPPKPVGEPKASRYRGRKLGARIYSDDEIAVAIAARLAGQGFKKSAAMIGASMQSLRNNWMKIPELVARGQALYERAREHAAAEKRRRLRDLSDREALIRELNESVLLRFSPRDVEILRRRMEGENLAALGREHGITRARACQILHLALARGLRALPNKPLLRGMGAAE